MGPYVTQYGRHRLPVTTVDQLEAKRSVHPKKHAPPWTRTALLTAMLFVAVSIAAIFAVALGLRTCSSPYPTLQDKNIEMRIAIVTMQDTRTEEPSNKLIRMMELDPNPGPIDVLALTWKNKASYCDSHGYSLVNATSMVAIDPDDIRPPAWQKLRSVMFALPEYDWVMWLDADTVVTNPLIKLESILPAPGGPQLIVTRDASGVNAGAWFIKNSVWGRHFLDQWWSSSSFIRPQINGEKLSGDNDALRYLLSSMPADEFSEYVGVCPQCAFNSYLWRNSARQFMRLLFNPRLAISGTWQPKDFVLHLAGFLEKFSPIERMDSTFPGKSKATRRWEPWRTRSMVSLTPDE